jgi:CBS domain-containing protein
MRVAEVMTRNVQTVQSQTSAADAWGLMRRHGIHHLVVMHGAAIVGVLSSRDTSGPGGAIVRARSTVGDLMTTGVVTVRENETIRKAANLLRGRTIGCVPVVEKGRLRGILTVSDLLGLLGRGVDRPSRPRRHDLRFRTPHRSRKQARAAW